MNKLFAAATACLLSSGAALAQTPVNFPPSDFEGRQFVDNKGCAYIRVGVGPTVDWVPRMTRSRDQVCGLQPTFRTPTQTVEAPAAPTPTPTQAKPAPQPARTAAVAEPAPTPAPKVARAKPSPAPAPTVFSGPKTTAPATTTRTSRDAPMATVASTVVARPTVAAPATVLAPTSVTSGQAVRTAAAPAPRPTAATSVCPERQGVSAQYTNADGVRCGPQPAAPVKVLSVGGANQPLPTPPKGYVRVWQDDRLNPYRGPRTAQGNAQSNQVWDTKTPRNLRSDRTAQAVQVATPAPTVRQGAGRYVQVATFSVAANAQRTAGRFQAAGFPVRVLNMRNGQQVVMVGAVPGGTLQQTLASARKAGFSDAYIR
ncbi:SPOR domain-containing protein [Donghicola eburneus]|uniref:Putative secreted protein n=1 Tax=Donghicola eburneus TaxID=393278 RepID=A0A1M4N1E2_9RHOB|nr:SPOR domain-containing protein [Donghicola eburneus]SCM66896.1 putative secreted protein [Donghicola eburneus]SFQ61399.1 hypothetical protein SAMN05421764_107173 [Donghicola eburneus]